MNICWRVACLIVSRWRPLREAFIPGPGDSIYIYIHIVCLTRSCRRRVLGKSKTKQVTGPTSSLFARVCKSIDRFDSIWSLWKQPKFVIDGRAHASRKKKHLWAGSTSLRTNSIRFMCCLGSSPENCSGGKQTWNCTDSGSGIISAKVPWYVGYYILKDFIALSHCMLQAYKNVLWAATALYTLWTLWEPVWVPAYIVNMRHDCICILYI